MVELLAGLAVGTFQAEAETVARKSNGRKMGGEDWDVGTADPSGMQGIS